MFRCRPLLSRVPRAGSPTSLLIPRHSDFSWPRRRFASRFASPFRLSPETTRPPRFLGNPSYACAGLRPRWRSIAGRDPGLAALRFGPRSVAFRVHHRVGLHFDPPFGARCRRPRTRCLRFAVWLPVRLQAPRKTRFRLAVLHLGRSGIAPAGHSENFTSLHDDSISPGLPGARRRAGRAKGRAAVARWARRATSSTTPAGITKRVARCRCS